MKKLNKNSNENGPVNLSMTPLCALTNNTKRVFLMLSAIILLCGAGCKKVNSTPDNYYGYGKLVISCGGKCHIEFGAASKMNVFDIDTSTATYSFRYQTKYDLNISITPTDKDQTVSLAVYSREEKQIFHNTVTQKVNVAWESTILVP